MVALPCVALLLLYINIKKEGANKINQYFLILYQGLKKERFYWEFVNTLRKVLILISLLFSTNTRIVLATFILVASARMQITLEPYKELENNNVDLFGMTAGIITLSSGLIYSQEDTEDGLNMIILVLVFIFNSFFILEWLYLLVAEYENTNRVLKGVISRLIL